MLFKGTGTRSAEDIAQAIDSIGGQLDAFTSKEYAGYYIKVLDEHLPLASTSSPTSSAPGVRPDEIEREKKVILEEIKMVEDTPDDLVHELFAQPSGRAIRSAARSSARARRSRRSTRPTLARVLRGAYVAPQPRRRGGRQPRARAVRDLVEASFGGCPTAGSDDEVPPRGAATILCANKDLEQSHVCLGTSGYAQHHEDRYAAYVLNTILGGSMSSRLFQNVREKRGLAYSVFSGLSAYRDAGTLTSTPAAPTRRSRARRLVVEELRGMRASRSPAARAAAREGSPQGQPDAEPREHVEPHVAPGAAGDLLRPPVQPRRDARRHRARDRRRRAARGRELFCNGALAGPCSAVNGLVTRARD
jgi:hypothetical protein